MKENKDIEKLFREKFKDFEAEVDPSVWKNVQAAIRQGAPAYGSGSKTGWSAAKIVAGLAGVAVVATGIYLAVVGNSDNEKTVRPVKTEVVEKTGIRTQHAEQHEQPAEQQEKPVVSRNTDSEDGREMQSGSAVKQDAGNIAESAENATPVYGKEHKAASEKVVEEKSKQETVPEPHMMNVDIGDKRLTEVVQTSINANPMGGPAPLRVSFNSYAEITRAKWDFGDGHSISEELAPEHIYEKPGVYMVTLIAENKDGKVFMDKSVVEVHDPVGSDRTENLPASGIEVPNVFTPNGDGINDYFEVKAENLRTFSITIYSQSGEIVYHSEDSGFKWDGTDMLGNLLPDGTYFYMITATGTDGKMYTPKAYIYIRRD